MTFHIREGDLEPPLAIPLGGATGDLSAVVSWKIRAVQLGAVLFEDLDGEFVIDPDDNAAGTITHSWEAGETATPGSLQVVVKATWPGGRQQTFPKRGYLAVRIHPAV